MHLFFLRGETYTAHEFCINKLFVHTITLKNKVLNPANVLIGNDKDFSLINIVYYEFLWFCFQYNSNTLLM